MKLVKFDSKTLPKKWGGVTQPKISFSSKGVININECGANLLKLKQGDLLSIVQNEDEPENWYIYHDKENGFAIRIKTDKKNWAFSHKELCETLRECFDFKETTPLTFIIAEKPTKVDGDKTEYWGFLSAD